MGLLSAMTVITIVQLLSEQIQGNTSFDDTSMKFSTYVLYMTYIQKRFLATSNLAIFQDGRQNKMADTSHEDVCSKLIISQLLFVIEQQTWYEIKAKSLPFCIKFKYAN